MKSKYNLALLPTSTSAEFIHLSETFHPIADQYLLGEHSLPHITLYQFYMEENKIDALWEKTSNIWIHDHISIELSTLSYTTADKKTYWIALLPKSTEILHEMHASIANIVELPPKKNYDPHLTLINTQMDNHQHEVDIISRQFHPIVDTFSLALGSSDMIGQFTKIIYQHKKQKLSR